MIGTMKKTFLLASVMLFALSGLSYGADSGETEEGVPWSYSGKRGPDNWGQLSDKYSECLSGGMQSPIDIVETKTSTMDHITFYYYNNPRVAMKNTGNTVELDYGDVSDIKLGGKDYHLKKIDFHTPSEHKLKGEQFPMEIHFVHKSNDGSIAIIGAFVKEGEENINYKDVVKKLPREKDGFKMFFHRDLNPGKLLSESREFYKYTGSITTPPCTEGVSWYILKEPVILSAEQINDIRKITGKNARPVQKLNGRSVRESIKQLSKEELEALKKPAEGEEGTTETEAGTSEEAIPEEGVVEDGGGIKPADSDTQIEEASPEESEDIEVDESSEEVIDEP